MRSGCALSRPLAFPLTLDLLLFSEFCIGEALVNALDDLRELTFQPACRGLGPAADARRVTKAKQLELQETGGYLVVLRIHVLPHRFLSAISFAVGSCGRWTTRSIIDTNLAAFIEEHEGVAVEIVRLGLELSPDAFLLEGLAEVVQEHERPSLLCL